MEMLELRETETARAMLRNTEPMQSLKGKDWERYRRLEELVCAKDNLRTYLHVNAMLLNVILGIPSLVLPRMTSTCSHVLHLAGANILRRAGYVW
eukprot:SAG31_NODE_3014_length_4786_cov_9.641135_9_plen_95_part_00